MCPRRNKNGTSPAEPRIVDASDAGGRTAELIGVQGSRGVDRCRLHLVGWLRIVGRIVRWMVEVDLCVGFHFWNGFRSRQEEMEATG